MEPIGPGRRRWWRRRAARAGTLLLALICACLLAPRRATANRARPTLSLSLRAPVEIVASTATPRWLEMPPEPPSDSVWGVPRSWLHGLADLDRVPVPLGGITLHSLSFAMHIDGLLRLSTDYPSLSAHVAFDLRGHHVEFALPSLQVVPHRQNGLLYVEVNMVLMERRF